MNTMDSIFGLARWSFFGFVMQYRKQGSKKKNRKEKQQFMFIPTDSQISTTST